MQGQEETRSKSAVHRFDGSQSRTYIKCKDENKRGKAALEPKWLCRIGPRRRFGSVEGVPDVPTRSKGLVLFACPMCCPPAGETRSGLSKPKRMVGLECVLATLAAPVPRRSASVSESHLTERSVESRKSSTPPRSPPQPGRAGRLSPLAFGLGRSRSLFFRSEDGKENNHCGQRAWRVGDRSDAHGVVSLRS